MTFPQQFAPAAPAPQAAPQAPAVNPASWIVGAAQDAGGNGVAMAHLLNRTVAIVPTQLLEGQAIRNQPGKFQDVIVADLLILDGGLFTFGGSPQGKPQPTPDTMRVDQLPYLAEGTRIYGVVIVNQLRGKVRSGISVGKVVMMRTGSGNDAYSLTTDATAEQLAFVQQWAVAHYQQRAFTNPPVTMLAGPQAPQNTAPQWPAQQPGVVAQPMAYAATQPSVPPAFSGFAAPVAPAPVTMDWTLTTMPPGVPADQLSAWQTQTTREQREQMLAASGITGPNVAPTQPTGL